MKSGTSSLGSYMAQHPDITFSSKRTNFFDQDKKWQLGPGWYTRFFEHARGFQAIGEIAPAYSYRPDKDVPVPERIASLLPRLRIIWILRNPIDRAYSHYWFNVFLGNEQRSFERALARNQKYGVTSQHDYQGRGVYVEQLKLYLRYFPAEQMHIMLLDDLKTDQQRALEGVYSFLGIKSLPETQTSQIRRNVTYRPRSVWLQYLLRKAVFHRNEKVFYRLGRAIAHRQPGYPPMNGGTREKLASFYAPCNADLAQLTRLDLSHWDQVSF